MLRDEIERGRTVALAAGARLRLLLHDPAADLLEIAAAAEEASLEACRVAGFARLLARMT